ncbi:MAG: LCP family protein [Clostridia bacterium]|nr:LCP family protein [Clostridia bacterium]
MNIRKFLTVIFCVLGVCLAILSGILVAQKMMPDLMGNNNNIAKFEGLSAVEPEGRVNILLLGVDMNESRTDTIILASLDNETKKLSIMSIPRDTRVTYKGRGDKITHVHLYGGETASIQAVKDLTGLDIHFCVVANYKGFRDVIDALGGVYINVPHVPNAWSNGRRGMYYDDPEQGLHIALPEGRQLLNGEECEGFVRFRNGYANADLDRIKNQQYFLTELFEQKMQPQYLLKANELYKVFNESVKTNYTVKMLASHLLSLKSMTSEDIVTMSMPNEPQTINGVSYVICQRQKLQEMIDTYFTTQTVSENPAQ